MPTLEITTKIGCENACAYCPQGRLLTAYRKRSDILLMSFGVFKACLDKVPTDVDIDFAGMCEPCLNPEYIKMLLYAYEKGHKIKLFTTLVGMALSDIDLLAIVPFQEFVVHLPSGEGYEKIKVDKDYLKVLGKLSKSNIKVEYLLLGETLHPKVEALIKENINKIEELSTRAGNVIIKSRPPFKRKLGVIGCVRNLSYNVLLPNGDVILCCMDYGMKHVLGNLLLTDYGSLFRSKEFFKIKKGLRRWSLDILCRYCDYFSYDISLFAKIYNSMIVREIWQFKKIRNLKDLSWFIRKAILKLKDIF